MSGKENGDGTERVAPADLNVKNESEELVGSHINEDENAEHDRQIKNVTRSKSKLLMVKFKEKLMKELTKNLIQKLIKELMKKGMKKTVMPLADKDEMENKR